MHCDEAVLTLFCSPINNRFVYVIKTLVKRQEKQIYEFQYILYIWHIYIYMINILTIILAISHKQWSSLQASGKHHKQIKHWNIETNDQNM